MTTKCQGGTWCFSSLHLLIPAPWSGQSCSHLHSWILSQKLVPQGDQRRNQAGGFQHMVCTTPAPTPTIPDSIKPLHTSHLCSSTQLHTQLLFSAGRLNTGQAIHFNLYAVPQWPQVLFNPLQNPETLYEGCTHVKEAGQQQSQLCSNSHSSYCQPSPFPQGPVFSHEQAGDSKVQGWGTSTNIIRFCSLVRVNQNTMSP